MRRVVLFLSIFTILVSAKEVYATFNTFAKRVSSLAFNTSGIVNKVYVDIGDSVKKEQILAKLKSDDIKANIELAKVSLEFAKRDYLRAKRAGKALDKAKLDAFEYKYKSAIAKLNYIKAIYKKSILRAPFDGVVVAKYIEVGDGISSMPPRTVIKVESLHKRKLILEFDQKYYKDVKVGDTFEYSFDGDSKKYRGKISKIYPTIDPKSAKAKAEVEVKDIPSGLFGTGTIITKE